MNRLAIALAALLLSACFKASPSTGTCNVDGDCNPGSTCNTSLHVCASACSQVCASGELCVDGKCSRQGPSIGQVIVTDNPAPSSNGYYPRNDAVTIPVSVAVDFGGKVAVGDANLVINGASLAATSKTAAGSVKTFVFQVPTTVQAQGKETPVTFKVTATDGIDTKETTPLASLKIDDSPPAVSAVAVIGGVAVGGTQWFQQSAAGDIEIQADIADNGSGVDAGSLQLLVAGTQRLDHGTPSVISGNRYAFKVARVIAGVIADGEEKALAFEVRAADRLGHSPTTLVRGKVGIDGKPPVIAGVTVNYPAAQGGCDGATAVTCGHDGAHFWRRGDAADGSDTGSITYSATDNGSGVSPGGATCAVTGSSKPCVVTAAGAVLTLTPNFSAATLSTPSDPATGGGTATVSLGIRDAVGNPAAPATATPAVSRLKWARAVSAVPTSVISLAGAPIVTAKPVDQVIVAGGASGSIDPIVALKPNGGLLWTAGNAQGLRQVTTNLAWDPTPSTDPAHPSPMLYAVDTNYLHAIHIAFPPGGTPVVEPLTTGHSYNCGLTNGIGSPAIFAPNPSPRVLVSENGGGNAGPTVSALGPLATGLSCARNNATIALQAGAVGPPTVGPLGAAYLGYDNSNSDPTDIGVLSAQFPQTGAASATPHKLGMIPYIDGAFSPVAIANGVFFGYATARTYQSYTPGFQLQWVTPPLAGGPAVALATPLVVANGLALGATKNPGKLYAFDKATGTQKWIYPATGNPVSFSPIATGSDGQLYFSDGTGEFVALVPPAGTAAAAPAWTFKGTGAVALGGAGNEPTLSATGLAYFTVNSNANGSLVYALFIDGGPLAANPAEWPRTGFDNCNSGNSTFSCQ